MYTRKAFLREIIRGNGAEEWVGFSEVFRRNDDAK